MRVEYAEYSRLIGALLDMDVPLDIVDLAVDAQLSMVEGDGARESTARSKLIGRLWEWVRE